MSDDFDDFADGENESNDSEEMEAEASVAAEHSDAAAVEEEGRRLTELEEAEQLTVTAKESLRREMEDQIQKFLLAGGKIQEVPPDVTADPPRKPESSYGSKPI